jgi:hypothetical protein
MRRIRVMGLCIVAVFAMSALVASTAAAASPEYYVAKNACTKKFGPIWGGGECTVTKKTLASTKITYTTTAGRSYLEGGLTITCSSSTGKGTINGPIHAEKLILTYHGCEDPAITSSCQTKGTSGGVITTEKIKTTLTEASEAPGGPLVDVNRLEPEKEYFAQFNCGPKSEVKVKVHGAVFTNPFPTYATPEEADLHTTGNTNTITKVAEPVEGCGHQQYLFEVGAGSACDHTFTNSGTSWNTNESTVAYKTALEVAN